MAPRPQDQVKYDNQLAALAELRQCLGLASAIGWPEAVPVLKAELLKLVKCVAVVNHSPVPALMAPEPSEIETK
jgi:hypothetical protein